jgi:hypothetical protein
LLTDFGVAARLIDPGNVAGSIPYMAPEAFHSRVSPALDVYSLAATCFHVATGCTPFLSQRIGELQEEIARGLPEPDPRCSCLPEPMERVIRAGLEPDPHKRLSLDAFLARLRGALNQSLVDSLRMSPQAAPSVPSTELTPGAKPKPPGPPPTEPEPPQSAPSDPPVDLRLHVSRRDRLGGYTPVPAAQQTPAPARVTRDMKKVPPAPDQVRLRTGDLVRLEVSAGRSGFLTVFNVGPAGALNLLYPEADSERSGPITAGHPLHIVEVQMTPPAGRERLVAVWTRQPLDLRLDQLHSLAKRDLGEALPSRPYVATRDMKRVQLSVQQLQPGDWQSAVLELDHIPS